MRWWMVSLLVGCADAPMASPPERVARYPLPFGQVGGPVVATDEGVYLGLGEEVSMRSLDLGSELRFSRGLGGSGVTALTFDANTLMASVDPDPCLKGSVTCPRSAVVRMNPLLAREWRRDLDVSVRGVGLDRWGRIYLGGGTDDSEIAVASVTSTGAVQWTQVRADEYDVGCTDLAVTPEGRSVCTGGVGGRALLFDEDGQLTGRIQFDDVWTSAAVWLDDAWVVVGHSLDEDQHRVWVGAFDESGSPHWSVQVPGAALHDVDVTPDGGIVAVGEANPSGSNAGILALGLDGDGIVEWTIDDDRTESDERVTSVSVAPDGAVVVMLEETLPKRQSYALEAWRQ